MESQAPVKRELPPVRGVRMGWTDENTSNGPNMGVEVNSKEDSTHEIEVDQLPELVGFIDLGHRFFRTLTHYPKLATKRNFPERTPMSTKSAIDHTG